MNGKSKRLREKEVFLYHPTSDLVGITPPKLGGELFKKM